MNIKLFSFLALSLSFGINAFSQIYPTGDTYTEVANPNDSFWDSDIIRLKHSVSESAERYAFLKFETASFPANYEQVLLKLVKVKGDEGNISIVAANPNFGASATWNNSPLATDLFKYGGYRSGDTCFLDVTDYFKNYYTNANEVAFKLFTTSAIVSPISFASSEATDPNSQPSLLFFDTQKYDLPLFSVFEEIDIETEKGTYTGNLFDNDPVTEERNNYGGLAGTYSNATGFFRVERDCEKTWHIIDPSGNIFYSAGLNSIVPGGNIPLPDEMTDMGINTMGCWSDESIEGLAYTPRFNVIKEFRNTTEELAALYEATILPVFDPNFKSFCENLAATELTPYLNDPWVLGYFIDNELPFYKLQLSLSLGLDVNNEHYIEADTWMTAKYGAAYTLADITNDDELDYQGHVAEQYFKVVSEAFRSVDPDHMLIGTRFHGAGKYVPQIFEACGNYMDIISVNYYGRFEPEEDAMEMWLESGKKPFMITEFYTKGQDSGLGNVDGAGWSVPTQQDRANWYENWMIKLLRNKGNVGFHWFRYIDKEGNDANKGVYSQAFDQYEILANSIAKVSNSIYSFRSLSLYGNSNYNGLINCDKELCGSTEKCELITGDTPFKESKSNGLYPNPTSGLLHFHSTSEWSITSILGEQLLTGNSSSTNISHLPKGVYIVTQKGLSTRLIKN